MSVFWSSLSSVCVCGGGGASMVFRQHKILYVNVMNESKCAHQEGLSNDGEDDGRNMPNIW